MDGNAKLGSNFIQGDPNKLSENGKLLLGIIQRQNLCCLNSSSLFEGTITRFRKKVSGNESSVLDYLIVCENLSSSLNSMYIDEKRVYTLTKYASSKGIRMKTESDHNPIFADFNIQIKKNFKNARKEIYLLKNVESQKKFTKLTDNCTALRTSLLGNRSPKSKAVRFFKDLDNIMHRSFKKIRLKEKKKSFTCKEEEKC